MPKTVKPAKQLTFDSLNSAPQKQADPKTAPQKQIIITQMETSTGIDELTLKIGFRLQPSRLAFSKVKADLFFETTHISSALIRVLQGPLATDESEYTWVFDMKGVPQGVYRLKVEMYELWSSDEKLNQTSRELTLDYVPQTRQARLVLIPTVKSVAGADLAVVSGKEKTVYSDIEKTAKKEQITKRDNY
jgi:hypothetical protein